MRPCSPVRVREGRPDIRVYWDGDTPSEVRQLVEPYVLRYLHLLPAWLTELRIFWDPSPDEAGAAMRTKISEEYRNGWLGICPKFLNGDEYFRHDTVVHEFVHFTVNPLWHLVLRLIDHVKADERFEAHLREDARRAVEGVTVDLTEAFMRLTEARPAQVERYPPPVDRSRGPAPDPGLTGAG